MAGSVQTGVGRSSRLSPGDQALDFTLTDTEGDQVKLSDLWKEKPVALVFLRHFGCIFCREQLSLLKRDYSRFLEAGGEIVCVGQGSHKVAKALKILLDLPFPILTCGDDLTVFRAWGLERATFGQIFGLSVLIRAIQAMLAGHRQDKVVGDGWQQPGAFVVDRKGVVRFAHRNKSAADHVLNTDLLKVLNTIERDTGND
ncbi:MAG TPA: peroxiredoxin-like family protein [Capsulimonadaceae bacterium]|nr:peroxiredoxin-like family protein [Capsulimonadaceae bacterium]